MVDFNKKKQDKNPDNALKDDGSNMTAEQSEELLAEVENLLNEEDPDFLNNLSKINIEQTLDLTTLGFDARFKMSLLQAIQQPFDFSLNLRQVLIFWSIVFLCVTTGVLVWNFKANFVEQKLFLTSFAELGGEIKEFNPLTEVEPFYDNLYFVKNLVTLSQLHANLKTSVNSGPNPMLAVEVTAEGLASDATIEIKDREAEFKDMLLRHTEEKTYDELVEPEGKQMLCDQFRDLINANLTKGQIRKVHIRSFIIKP